MQTDIVSLPREAGLRSSPLIDEKEKNTCSSAILYTHAVAGVNRVRLGDFGSDHLPVTSQ